MHPKTHYDNLQVTPGASAEVIRASYRALMQKYHPDRFHDAARGERICKIINQSFAVLSDPPERREYDVRLARRQEAEGASAAPSPSPQSTTAPSAKKSSPSPSPPSGDTRPRPVDDAALDEWLAARSKPKHGVREPETHLELLQKFFRTVWRGTKPFILVFTFIGVVVSIAGVVLRYQRAPAPIAVASPRPAQPSAATLAAAQLDARTYFSYGLPSNLPDGSTVYLAGLFDHLVEHKTPIGVDGPGVTFYKIIGPQADGPANAKTLIERPFNSGVLATKLRKKRIAPLRIDLPHTTMVYLLKLVDASTDAQVMTLMGKGGESLEAEVPLGTFRLRYLYGPHWFGPEDRFASAARASRADADLEFSRQGDRVLGHTIELIQQKNGNLSEEEIDPAAF